METENAIHEAFPYLRVRNANEAIEFYKIHLHVDDVDAMTSQAVSAGAKLTMEPANQFHGERSSKVIDPFGHEWYLGSKIENVSREEMQRRFDAMFEND